MPHALRFIKLQIKQCRSVMARLSSPAPTMPARCVTLLCCVVATLSLHVAAEDAQRCTEAVAGDVVGYAVELEPIKLEPDGRKIYTHSIDTLEGCSLNGVTAQVCDTYAPEVDVENNLTQVTVRRLGPHWHPISLDMVLYCDPLYPAFPSEESSQTDSAEFKPNF